MHTAESYWNQYSTAFLLSLLAIMDPIDSQERSSILRELALRNVWPVD